MDEWHWVADGLPEVGRLVEATTESGDVRELRFDRMWWLPDKSMYVYFSPVKWRYVDEVASR